MIGPAPTFYNAEDTSLQQGLDSHYQQWIESYDPQQHNQQGHQHYSQQMVYNNSYHGGSLHAPIPQTNLSFDFTRPQYESSSSLSQYDGSTTGTVTQFNVGQNRDNSSLYQGQSNLYSQGVIATPERTLEVVNHPSQGSQQNPSQQSHQQQVRRKPPRAPQVQQSHAHRFLAHPSSSENRPHASSNPSPSHSSSLTPPNIVWASEPGYSNPRPIENANLGGQSFSRAPSSNSGSSRPPTSQNTPAVTNSPNPIQFNPGVSGSSPRTSPPGASNSTFVSEKTGHKRKRRKKTQPAQLSGGGESDSDSEYDETGGISVGMGGLGVVGKGATRGSRL